MFQAVMWLLLLGLVGCQDSDLVLGDLEDPPSEQVMLADAKHLRSGNKREQSIKTLEDFLLYYPASSSRAQVQSDLMKMYDELGRYDSLEPFAAQVALKTAGEKKQEALWYQAVANWRLSRNSTYAFLGLPGTGVDTQRLEKALELLNQLAKGKGSYAKAAEEIKIQVEEGLAEQHIKVVQYYQRYGKEKAWLSRWQYVQDRFKHTQAVKAAQVTIP